MPAQGKAKGSRRNEGASSSAAASDPRFASMTTDPRFRLPSARHSKVGVDKRFSRMFKDDDFSKKATVDKYGRKVSKGNAKKELERFYKIEDGDEEEADEESEEEMGKAQKVKAKKSKKPTRDVVGSDSEGEEEVVADDDEIEAELKRLDDRVRDPAREGGFSSSEDDSSSEDESEEEEEIEDDAVEFPNEGAAEVPLGDVSSRLAVVNLDWDNIRAEDLMAVAQSFASTGRVSKVVVYPSEFGKERMEKEELEGPPRDIFASATKEIDEDEDTDDEEERIKKELLKGDTGEEFDSAKLRQYQLDRLKYYYAVITCDSKETAKSLYDGMDGREYLSTANFFDLRFIPDEVDFDTDTPRDECTKITSGYKPNEFVTEALTHSKVRLTWDADDTTRKEVQKRAFSRAEIDENDLQAYIGSDSSDGEDDDTGMTKAEQQRQKMRAALGLSSAPSKSKSKDDGPVGDMQITFTSGLSNAASKANGVFENEPIIEETTREKYIRKEKERKARRKEKMKASRNGETVEEGSDDDAISEKKSAKEEVTAPADEEDPFNDPFFNDTVTAQKAEKQARKADRQKKREAREAADAATAAKRAELELLMVDDKSDNMRHFNMNEIAKAEKTLKKKSKNNKKAKDAAEVLGQDDFNMETQDPRFAKLFESHEFAIDPTNPRFKGTQGMKALLEEGRRKRKGRADEDGERADAPPAEKREKKAKTEASSGGEDLNSLLARVKAKTKAR
ncbi:hypothetical protein D6D25_01530 [Aureobasidium pullulans]|nr:hypothetical protein D6D25_01530 [Aureobasidium pullulans]